eukprot:6042881-Amphidinium_carterae.3
MSGNMRMMRSSPMLHLSTPLALPSGQWEMMCRISPVLQEDSPVLLWESSPSPVARACSKCLARPAQSGLG